MRFHFPIPQFILIILYSFYIKSLQLHLVQKPILLGTEQAYIQKIGSGFFIHLLIEKVTQVL